MLKKCSQCHSELPATPKNFVPAPSCKSGLSHVCRKCRANYHRAWKKKNAERLKERRRYLYLVSEKVVEAKRLKRRWVNDPHRQRAKLLREGMRERSKKLSLPFDSLLFTRDFLAGILRKNPHCPCCGVRFRLKPKGGCKSDDSPSIDRFVPERGYVANNIALICWRCNNIKRNYSSSDLRRVADWMDRWGNETDKFEVA